MEQVRIVARRRFTISNPTANHGGTTVAEL